MSQSDPQSSLIRIEVEGSAYPVPEGITVIQAMWRIGRPMIHGVGCLGGVCGACPITYRLPDQLASKTALACQTAVRDGMAITFIPSDASKKAIAPLPKEAPTQKTLFQYYPETRRCTACRACSSVCPQEIDVMGGVRAAINGDLSSVAEKFTTCVMCGLCAAVCEVQIRPHRVGMYARRLTGAFYPKEATGLLHRIEEVRAGKYESAWSRLLAADDEALSNYCRSEEGLQTLTGC